MSAFKDPVLNKMLQKAINTSYRKKHPGVLSTLGSKKLGRKSKAYLIWRKYILKRDNYSCVKCGSTKRIQAHHKKAWSKYKNQGNRFNVNNGITLCFSCHKLLHPWLR